MPLDSLGRWLIVIGLVVVAAGALLFLLGKLPFLKRLGNLPGDLNFESRDERVKISIPIASSLLISLLLTIILNVIAWLLRRR